VPLNQPRKKADPVIQQRVTLEIRTDFCFGTASRAAKKVQPDLLVCCAICVSGRGTPANELGSHTHRV